MIIEALSDGELDNSLNELLQVFIGFALIKKTENNPELNKSVRKKVIKELEKTQLYQDVIVRPAKEN
jgi:hypothetical protein